MKKDMGSKHTFVICAFKESEFLEECIESLLAQTVKSTIIMVTSTPNEYISSMAKKYNIPLYVNTGVKGISADWNFGISMAKTKYVTVAHQDDFYKPYYTEKSLRALMKTKDAMMSFTNHNEIRNGKEVHSNKLLKVKRLMLWPLGISFGGKNIFASSRFVRRRILSMGNPISCPSVMFNLHNVQQPIFVIGMRSNVDWEAWDILSKKKGSFVYIKDVLVCHRVHGGSATTEIIADSGRTKEDFEMFCRFWPKSIARLIMRWYSKGQESNKLS